VYIPIIYVIDLFVFSIYAGRQCPAPVERKMLYGNMVKMCTQDFDVSIVTRIKEEVVPLDETSFGWARL
jgi:hypothetical protein